MTVNSTESHFAKQPKTTNSSNMTVLGTQLHSGTVYVFTLTVHKAGRSPVSFNQTVTTSEAPVFPVIVDCVSCSLLSSPHQISYTTPTVLSGQCGQCDDRAQYKWSAEDQTGVTLDLNEVSTSTGRHSPNLVVRSGVLQPGQSYTFTLNVSQPGRWRWGSASLTIHPNNPPHGGLCELSPDSDIRLLETVVTYNCSGWQDDESGTSQLIYTFQVAPCHPNGPVCPLLTLYRGTRSAYGSLVPMGSPGQGRSTSVISVTLLVEDHLGAKVIALNRMLTVETPPKDAVANQWLRNKSQTELWALVQQGNPQEIIPYSIALTSQLNQMDAGQTAVTLLDRREIRENVTRVLASLPVSSMLNVDQISSALSLSTAVPSELVSEKCQEKVLEAVGKMIHVMEEQMSPGVLSAVETGRNILNIIGSTLAAVSIRASSSHHDTLHLASSNVLLALNHAGALMRSLMHAQMNDKAPLLLSNDYINTVSFHGDPSELLCTQKSNQHQIIPSHKCQFLIPSSLTDHLQNQKTEIVQVLFDADIGSNPFLTAADPPISTSLVAMELTTPQGQPITIQDLDPDQAIRVTLPNKHHIGLDDGVGAGNGTCLTVMLPSEGMLNFTVKAVDGLDENAGSYISFNFSLDSGATPVSLGHVRIEVSSAVPGTNASWGSLVREWALNLSDATPFMEETIFLSPLLNRTDQPLSVQLSSSLVSGGPVCVSMCVFSAVCQYYSVQQRRWSSEGLQPLEGSTLQSAHCLTQHLTMFGASMFLHPGALVLLPPPGGPVRNLLVGMVCAVLVLIHLLLGLIAHKLDHLERTRLSRVPLCGRPGLHQYRVLVKTGHRRGAGTTAHVGISLYGVSKSGARHLRSDGAFQRGGLDQFHLETDESLGEVWKIRIWHDNTGLDPSWFVEQVVVWDPQTDHMFFFLLEDWLSVENQKNGSVEKEVLASCPEELSQFRRVFSSQLVFGMVEHHLWLSLWERPAHSRFSRGQRVTCSAVVLHLYLALGALWYGAVGTQGLSGPVSARLLVNMEAVSVGMTVAALVFPLQWFLCFLFRKSHSQVTVDTSVPPSPICHSVEMDVFLGQSDLSGPSFLSLSDSSSGPSSLLDSKALDSSILDFWAASGLAPQKDRAHQEGGGVETWPSCDSLLNLPACITETPILCKASPSSRQLRRKKQIRLAAPASNKTPTNQNMKSNLVQVHSQNLTTLLTLSEEDLLMSIAAASEDSADLNHSNSDSGRDSPRTISSLSTTRSRSCSSWSEVSESVFGLFRSPSVISVDSVASTFLPSPSPDSSRSPSITRIGVSRGVPGLLLPPWTLTVIYPLLASLLIASLAVIGLYGSSFSRALVLMWLLVSLSAFLTSALLLEPLKVCVQALICTLLWRPVDPEVEDHLALQSLVDLRGFGDDGGRVRPPCGFSLLQAREEARKLRTLRALMRRCVSQLSFLLLVLMLNYQAGVEQRDARLLRSSVRRELHSEGGGQNLTSLRGWSDAEQWMIQTLVPHLHQNPTLQLVGLPRLQHTHTLPPHTHTLRPHTHTLPPHTHTLPPHTHTLPPHTHTLPPHTHTLPPLETVYLGNSSVTTQQLFNDLHMSEWTNRQFKTLSLDFTHFHRESGLFVCVSIKLEWVRSQRLASFLSILPFLIPSPHSGPDLQAALTVLLLVSALLMLSGGFWSMSAERSQYFRRFRNWFQLLLALLSLTTSILQLCFLSQASNCVSELRSDPDSFVDFLPAALLSERSSQSAAVLLTLLLLKLLGSLRFVRRWGVLVQVLQGSWREIWALMVLMMLLLLICTHLGNTLFSRSVEGFLSLHQSGVSVLSMLRGRASLKTLCRIHPVLGPLYGLLIVGGGVWILARICGAVLILAYRVERAQLYRPTFEPQDYDMVEFFIKRLRLWMGLSKTKEFRHSVKFEGMDAPPSRSSQESHLSSRSPSSSSSSSSSSPRPPSSSLSLRSEDSFDVQPHLDRLLPCVTSLLSRFDQINQITDDLHDLEVKLEEAQVRRRKISEERKRADKPKEVKEVRHRKIGLLHPKVSLPSSFFVPSSSSSSSRLSRARSTSSESEPAPYRPRESCRSHDALCGLNPAASPGDGRTPRRRAWHSGSSHSADAAQRILQTQGGVPLSGFTDRPRSEEGVRRGIREGAPVKRKAWIEQD